MIALVLANWRLVLWGIGVAAVIGLSVTMYEKVLHRGEQIVIDKVKEQNNEAVKRADQSGDRVNNCYDSGGVWNLSSGRCERGVPGSRP